jgi:hypothetical protein
VVELLLPQRPQDLMAVIRAYHSATLSIPDAAVDHGIVLVQKAMSKTAQVHRGKTSICWGPLLPPQEMTPPGELCLHRSVVHDTTVSDL